MRPTDGDNFNHETQDYRRASTHSRRLRSSGPAGKHAIVRGVGASRGTAQSIVRGFR
jgi:hypothetical protein